MSPLGNPTDWNNLPHPPDRSGPSATPDQASVLAPKALSPPAPPRAPIHPKSSPQEALALLEGNRKRLASNAARVKTRRNRRDKASEALERGKIACSRALEASDERANFLPTPEMRAQVETLSGYGFRTDEIASIIFHPKTGKPISATALSKHFKVELIAGPVHANSSVAAALYETANSEKDPGKTQAGIFIAKARMGWRETQHVEVDLKAGVMVAPAMGDAATWVESTVLSNEGRLEPGATTEPPA